MRIGNNPLRFEPAPYQMKDIVFLVVTHIPDTTNEYHKDRMEVVKTCLQTMRDNSKRDHTFIVWDNESKEEFAGWLRYVFEPDVLVLSKNVGKNNARAAAINMLPLGSIVCYSDDDVYFYDNWLNPQIELLNHFPGVSVVSGYPVRTQFRWGTENTIKWARANAKVKQGRLISEEYERDFCTSVGRDWQYHLDVTAKDIDHLIKYNGKEAYATAHHCQFIGYVATIRNHLWGDGMAMGDEKVTDIELDRAGLRLCTTKRYVRHIGNVLDDSFKELLNVGSVQEQV